MNSSRVIVSLILSTPLLAVDAELGPSAADPVVSEPQVSAAAPPSGTKCGSLNWPNSAMNRLRQRANLAASMDTVRQTAAARRPSVSTQASYQREAIERTQTEW